MKSLLITKNANKLHQNMETVNAICVNAGGTAAQLGVTIMFGSDCAKTCVSYRPS